MTTDQLYATSQEDMLRKTTIFGNGVLGDAEMGNDFMIPYKYTPEYIKKVSNFSQYPNPGFIAFQCIKEPPYLLNSYSNKEGLFTSNEVFYKILKKHGFEEVNTTKDITHYYDAYKPLFTSPEKIVKYIRPFGITSNGGLSENEKRTKSYQTQYCVYGKVNHSVFFPKESCAGLINNNQFIPVPNHKLYGDIYVYLAFNKQKDLKFYFSDNPAFTNLIGSDKCSDELEFSMVLKVGQFQSRDINIVPTFVHNVNYYETSGFIFCPDYNWSFYHNPNYNDEKSAYFSNHHPTYIYDTLTDFI